MMLDNERVSGHQFSVREIAVTSIGTRSSAVWESENG